MGKPLSIFSFALILVLFCAILSSCGNDDDDGDDNSSDDDTVDDDDNDDDSIDDDDDDDNDDDDDDDEPIIVMTFNVGTATGLPHDVGDDGYTSEMADIADELYENSLSWNPAEEALRQYLAELRPAVAVFQENYYDPWCEDIPVDPELDFVCKDYSPERPTQLERLFGPDYQVACSQDHPDNCGVVRRDFGTFAGCNDEPFCLDGFFGMAPPSGCTSRSRVWSIVINKTNGEDWTLVNVHASSGFERDVRACRADQIRQIFEDRGDGQPLANGDINLVMGDINTDPFLAPIIDESARVWNQNVGDGLPFDYLSADRVGIDPNYALILHVDHVVSDILTGSCVVPGVTDDMPPVMDAIYWDHKPVVCQVTMEIE